VIRIIVRLQPDVTRGGYLLLSRVPCVGELVRCHWFNDAVVVTEVIHTEHEAPATWPGDPPYDAICYVAKCADGRIDP
jgi:hypothetical protein